MNIAQLAQATIQNEIEALQKMSLNIDPQFEAAVKCLHIARGRVIISGIGKSAIIAQKIVATFNSTGTPAVFMHAADAIHGDLGMIQADDIVIIISKSGESPEIKVLIPFIKNFGNTIIAISGNTHSTLAKGADYILDTTVATEACPNNLAPTTSTTAQLVMGDCLAICLLQLKGFTANDFAKFHPGGALGKRLYLTAGELCEQNEKPAVQTTDTLDTIIIEMTSKTLGATVVLEGTTIVGMITDGDLRRMLQHETINYKNITAKHLMSEHPKSIQKDDLAANALDIMRKHDISQLIVQDNGKYIGMIHLHDLIKAGII